MTGKQPVDFEEFREKFRATYELPDESITPLLQVLHDSLNAGLARADEAVLSEKMDALVLAAHSIKGILLNAGLPDWADFARNIEMWARAGEKKDYQELLRELREGLRSLLQ